MEDVTMEDMADATLLQLKFPKVKMITTHPRMAIATVAAKMDVVLAVVPMVARIFIWATNDLLVGLSAALSCKQDHYLVQTITFHPCHKMHKGFIQEECCHPISTEIRNPTCHKPWP
eukprot:10803392-Ditylum_brightwellii.AAC.1